MTPRTITIAFVAAGVLSIILALSASAQSTSTVALVGADAGIDGNTATTLGSRDVCISVNPAQRFPIDIFVDQVPTDRPLIGFQINVQYDASILTVVEANHDFLLGAVGQYQPFPGLSDPLPDTDGVYNIVIADLASNSGGSGANSETGPGVLSRLTFEAKAAGTSDVGPLFTGTDQYPALQDSQNQTMDVVGIAETLVAVGQPCPADVTPEEQTTVLPPLVEIEEAPPGTVFPPPPTLAPNQSLDSIRNVPAGDTPTPTPVCATPSPTQDPDSTATTTPATTDAAALPTCEPTPSPSPSPSPSPTSASASPTITPKVLPAAGDESDTGAIIIAIALGAVGLAAISSGGWLLRRRGTGT
jgi:hypothetical protein